MAIRKAPSEFSSSIAGHHLTSGSATRTGRRSFNEDAIHASRLFSGSADRIDLFAVADGIGGHLGGGLASRMACQALSRYRQRLESGKRSISLQMYLKHLEETLFIIDRQIRRFGVSHKPLTEMGTTLSCLVIGLGHSLIAHVGDSRIFRLRRGHLSCLTQDHTFVEDMISDGEIDPADRDKHPLRHMLTRAVGTAEPLECVDTRIDPARDGDCFLLCTDGLYNSLSSHEIAFILTQPRHAAGMAEILVNEAFNAGSGDNITALVVHYDSNRHLKQQL